MLRKIKKILPLPLKSCLKKILDFIKSLLRKRTVRAKIDGIFYELDLREAIDSAIYYQGGFEPDTVNAINQLCKSGMVVLDIGANIGCHTLRFAKLTNPQGKVIAFEPMSWAFSKLQKNISLNNFNNIILEKITLSNENKEKENVKFACSWPLDKKPGLHPIHHGRIMEDKTDIITLDTYAIKNNINKIDLIKLDVDGYELKVIQGGVQTLKIHKPIIIMELGKYTLKEVGDNIKDLISLCIDLGYQFYEEKRFKKFNSKEEIIQAVPDKHTINAIASTGDLSI